MYINFWYPMIGSEDLDLRKPERARAIGPNFAIFRAGQGQARVLSDTCVRRGGSLGGAWELHGNPHNTRARRASSPSTCATSCWRPTTTASDTRDVLMPADRGVVAYPQRLSRIDDKGWRIDREEFTRRNGRDTSSAMPSPRRRGCGNRVLKSVPLLASRASRNASEEATGWSVTGRRSKE